MQTKLEEANKWPRCAFQDIGQLPCPPEPKQHFSRPQCSKGLANALETVSSQFLATLGWSAGLLLQSLENQVNRMVSCASTLVLSCFPDRSLERTGREPWQNGSKRLTGLLLRNLVQVTILGKPYNLLCIPIM